MRRTLRSRSNQCGLSLIPMPKAGRCQSLRLGRRPHRTRNFNTVGPCAIGAALLPAGNAYARLCTGVYARWVQCSAHDTFHNARQKADECACRGLEHDRARQEALLSKWCKPLTHHDPVGSAQELAKYQKRLIGVYGRSGSALVTGHKTERRVKPGPKADTAAADHELK